jgi:hypothetical protein
VNEDLVLFVQQPEGWAKINANGELVHFDRATCRRLAEEFKAGNHSGGRIAAALAWALIASEAGLCEKAEGSGIL